MMVVLTLMLFYSVYSSDYFFPYTLQKGKDISLYAGGGGIAGVSLLIDRKNKSIDTSFITSLKISDINRFDRSAVYNWSRPAHGWSNVTITTSVVSPLLLLAPMIKQKKGKDIGTFAVMYSQIYLANLGVMELFKRVVKRPRPYLYGNQISLEEKLQFGFDGKRSFYSGHTANAFAGAVFCSTLFSKMYPQSALRPWVWVTTLSTATATGYLRYKAGKHFPTDIIVGALVGSTMGYVIPLLHEQKGRSNSDVRIQPNGITVVFAL